MPNFLPKSIRVLIEELSKLPGIGPKSAQRLAIYLLHQPENGFKPLGEAILKLKKDVVFCSTCWNIAESDPCKICDSLERDKSIICVVEEILDVAALEKTGEYKGVYHVLHGVLSPIDGLGPDQLKLNALFERVHNGFINSDESAEKISEVIIATNPSLEGEATALYIQKQLHEDGVKITRIARGIPIGGDLEYADEVTLSKALQGRSEF